MPAKVRTPGMITFVGILLIVVGGWSLLGGLCGGGGLAFAALSPDPGGPQAKAMPGDANAVHRFFAKEVPGYFAVTFLVLGIDMLFGLGQLIAGIGLFKLSPLARILAIGLTLGKLLLSLAGHLFQIIFVLPAQKKFFDLNPPLPPGQQAPFDIQTFTQSLTVVILGITVLIQLAIAFTIVLVLMTNKSAFTAPAVSLDEGGEGSRSRYEGYDDDDDRPRKPPKFPGDTGITDQS